MTDPTPESGDRVVQPTRERPGRPVASGFTLLSPAEQEAERERWAEVQACTATFREEADLCRARAMAAARTAVIR